MELRAKSRLLQALAERLDEYIKRLAKTHIKKLGAGHDSLVFPHPTDPELVVKLCQLSSAPTAWAQACLKHRGNRWLPGVSQITRTRLRSFSAQSESSFAVIFSERLKPCKSIAYPQAQIGHDLVRDLYNDEPESTFERDLKGKPADLVKALRLVASGYPRFTLDLSAANYMMRGQQVVINDPWINPNSSDLRDMY